MVVGATTLVVVVTGFTVEESPGAVAADVEVGVVEGVTTSSFPPHAANRGATRPITKQRERARAKVVRTMEVQSAKPSLPEGFDVSRFQR